MELLDHHTLSEYIDATDVKVFMFKILNTLAEQGKDYEDALAYLNDYLKNSSPDHFIHSIVTPQNIDAAYRLQWNDQAPDALEALGLFNSFDLFFLEICEGQSKDLRFKFLETYYQDLLNFLSYYEQGEMDDEQNINFKRVDFVKRYIMLGSARSILKDARNVEIYPEHEDFLSKTSMWEGILAIGENDDYIGGLEKTGYFNDDFLSVMKNSRRYGNIDLFSVNAMIEAKIDDPPEKLHYLKPEYNISVH